MDASNANLTAAIQQITTAQYTIEGVRQNLQPVRTLKAGLARQKLAALARKPTLRLATFQLAELELETDIPNADLPVAVELRDFDSFAQLCDSGFRPDVALYRSHQFWKIGGNYDFNDLVEAPRRFGDCLSLVWLWDHHHGFDGSGKMALLVDVVLPMHESGADYLKAFNDYVFSAVPAACGQWGGPRFVEQVYREHEARPRSDRLYGGFVEYVGFRRNAFIRECMARIPDHALTLLPETGARDIQHFGVASRRDRLVEWMGHKCSLVCALTEDIPIRVLDGLLAGQIPLVPYNLNGFDRLISPALQTELPIVRYDPYDIGSAETAWRAATRLFDRDGTAGAARRHRFAADNHLMKHRVADIVRTVFNAARPYAPA